MKHFFCTLLPLLAFSLASPAQAAEPAVTEFVKIECRHCQGRGRVQGTSDYCGACDGSGKVNAELVNVMPSREVLVKAGCPCGGQCNCLRCDCGLHIFTSEPNAIKPTKLYPAGYYWERLDGEEWGLRCDGKQIGSYRIADRTYLPFDGERWGSKCQPPTDLPGAPQRVVQQTYLPMWGVTAGCSSGR